MLTPGTLLQNRYEIMRLIGRGGMGAVYQAKDHRLGHHVALKQMLVEDQQLRQAFEREARILASLHHPVLPGVSDHFAEGDGQFLVMRYIPGDDLATMLEKQAGALPIKHVLAWADQLLEALEYLHGQQPPIIHRDIKPQNMKVTQRGKIVLLDFGLAKGGNVGQTTRMTTTGGRSIFGYTPHYAPLEQIQGTGTDPRSDIYALGATLYHLLTATQPPDALARATSVLNNRPDPLQPPHFINQQIPLALSTLLMQSMSHNANDRPPSAALMRQMLQNPSSAQTRIVAPYPPVLPNQDIYSAEASTRIHQSAAPASYTAAPYQGATQRAMRQPSTTTRTPQKKNPFVLVLAGIATLLFVFLIGMGGWWLSNNGSQPGDEIPEVVIVDEIASPTETPTETVLPTETIEQASLNVTQESLPAEATQPTQSITPTIEEVIPPTETTTPTEEASTPTKEASTPTKEASTPTEAPSPEPNQPTHTPIPLVPTNTPLVPTNTPFVPTNTPFVPTNTPFVPTNTPPPPTNTPPPPPTNTPPPPPTNTPPPPPTNTPPPPPTNTPPPPPTNTPPPPPTNTPPPPPTNTPIPPPTITNTPLPVACSVPAGSTFASIWQNNRDLMGCALENQIAIPTMAEQLFEGGHMFWRSDTDDVYVIYDRLGGGWLSQGSWQTDSRWVWDNSDPDGVGKSPPPGYQEPLRGFGWVWRTFLNAENGSLGWAIDREYGFDNIGQAQRFENGLMFKGSDPAIYMLFYNGSFSRQ